MAQDLNTESLNVIISYLDVFVLAEEGLSHTCEDTSGCSLGEALRLGTSVLSHEYVQHHYLSAVKNKHHLLSTSYNHLQKYHELSFKRITDTFALSNT